MATVRLATRGSPLARAQADRVGGRLRGAGAGVEIVVVESEGDRRRDVPIGELAGRGVFTTEVDAALLSGRADLAVHSAKDLPASAHPEGLEILAVPERVDVRDALVGRSLEDLPAGGTVATGSARRRVQLGALRPDLVFSELRGNIATRLERCPPTGSVVVALAALERLGLEGAVAQVLDVADLLPQVGQGAIALVGRPERSGLAELAEAIDDAEAHRCLLAERAFLAALGGGCDAPVGGYATIQSGTLSLEVLVGSPDGHFLIRRRATGEDPLALGRGLGESLVALANGALVELP